MTLSGNPFDFLIAFLGGVLVSFTPCIYPLIPISAGFIAIDAAGSKIKGFALSLIYVTGIAITYSMLGLLASLTGTIFGRISSHPVTYFFAGGIIIIFGLSMMDLFTIRAPNLIKIPKVKKQGFFAAFILGLSSGLIVSPCLTPVLGSILFYLSTKKNLFYGAALLFIFAYGMGLVLILVGTFSATIINLPKLGRWMLYIKRTCAFILVVMGIYFIYTGITRL
jgi:thiol:disulfide interchange protein DsbD